MEFEDPEKHMAACKADLKKFATEVLQGFRINGAYPPYLRHLFNELSSEVAGMSGMSRQDYFGSEVAGMSRVHYLGCGWYMEFLQNHPALLTDAARIGLIQGWYHCINDIDYERLVEFKGTICGMWEWTRFIREKPKDEVDQIAWLTFWHKAKKPSADADVSTWKSRYRDTWAQCHRFLRQLVVHAYRLTKFAGGNQSAKETVEPELYAATLMPTFLPEFIKLLLRQGMMIKDFLLYWKAYCAQR